MGAIVDPNETKRNPRLLEEFPNPALEQWREEVVRLLKGIPFDKKMKTPTYEGVTLHGMYTSSDISELDTLDVLPGDMPFVRGTKASGHRVGGWQIAQALPFPTYHEFNKALQHDLARGQTAVNLILDEATQAGLDPDQAAVGQVGKGGTSIASVKGMTAALDGIDLDKTPLHVEAGSAALPAAALVVALMRSRGMDVARWRGSCGMDPLAGLAEYGELPIPLEWAYNELAILTRWAHENAPDLKTICVYGHPYRDAGADAATELACAMATAVEALRQMEQREIDVDISAPRYLFGFTTGSDFFMEIAKLRAARMMWARIIEASNGSPESAKKMHIHSRTSTHRLSALDPHTNILRGATEAFAAITGGADSVHVQPFDRALRQVPSVLARRIARNTQIVLLEEMHGAAVIDPAGGSYFVEKLTDDLANTAWQKFQQIEANGGMLKSLQSGTVQAEIAELRQKRLGDLGTRKDILVGLNRYPNSSESPMQPEMPDWEAIHRQRSEKLQKLRTESSQKHELKVMEKLQQIVESESDLKFDTMVEAAELGATIGEFTSSLRHQEKDIDHITPLGVERAAEPFEHLRRQVVKWQGSKPAVFLANVGPFADYMPRLDFARSFYQVGGFTVQGDDWYKTARDAADAAKQSGAKVVVIVGLDTGHDEAVPAIAGALKGSDTIVHLAGYPKEEEQRKRFKAQGVDEFIHLRSDILKTLSDLASKLGVK